MTTTTAPASRTAEPVEIVRHMISRDWGIVIDLVTLRSGAQRYRCSTVGRILGVGLRSVEWASFDTEDAARDEANNEWRIQTDRPARPRARGHRRR